ncbi:MAG: metalloregulator ArsR/SmtB family transcription factor [Paracoccaceae bacterium]
MVDHSSQDYIINHMVEDSEHHLDLVFAALSDRTRRTILLTLLEGDLSVKDIAAPFDISLAAISKHIQILTKAELVTQTKIGRTKLCHLEMDAFSPAAFWIESYGQFLDDGFDTLERALALQSEPDFLRIPDLD